MSSGNGTTGWRAYWEGDASVYVNTRHKIAHYQHLADDLLRVAAALGRPLDRIDMLDFGCGEALSADRIAARIHHLTLSDTSQRVRDGLARRFGDRKGVSILDAEAVAALPDAAFDLIVVNSVLQYVSPDAATELIRSLARLVKPDGRMLVGDVLPPELGALTDVREPFVAGYARGETPNPCARCNGAFRFRELLAFAVRERFLVAALAGLVRTALSDYSRIRARVGLTRYSVVAFERLARSAGLQAEPLQRNIGHNPHRLAFLLRRANGGCGAPP